MKPTNDTNTDVSDYLLAVALDTYETAARTSERESQVTPVAAVPGQTPATTAMAAPHVANEPHLPKPSSGYRRNRTPSSPCLSSRFAPPVTQSAAREAGIPKTTNADTKYCVGVFEEWKRYCETCGTTIPMLTCMTNKQMSHWMTCFILEARKRDGTVYPPNTVHHLVAGVQPSPTTEWSHS